MSDIADFERQRVTGKTESKERRGAYRSGAEWKGNNMLLSGTEREEGREERGGGDMVHLVSAWAAISR